MVTIHFSKYHGNGNDFIIIDSSLNSDKPEIGWFVKNATLLCHRHKGIGADGIIILNKKYLPYHISVINKDGSLAKNCGNGLRCVAHHIFLQENKSKIEIVLGDHTYEANRMKQGIKIDMGLCTVKRQDDLYLKCANVRAKVAQANIGNEHLIILLPKAVIFEDAVKEIKDQVITTDINIGFLYQNSQGFFCSHVYERGVGFTKACGTGASAAASFLALLAQPQKKISLNLYQPGGEILVNVLTKSIENNNGSFAVDQCSKATLVFTGIFQASDTC